MTPLPRRVWLLIAVLLLTANLPYAVGYINAPEGSAFSGNAFAQTRVDYNSHLAKMQLGLRGDWLYSILFTPEEHPAHLIQTFYTALGQLARLTGLPLVAVYHLARLAASLLMLVMVWQFVCRFVPDDHTRWWAVLLGTVTGGLGWVLYLIMPEQTAGLAPVEFWLLDAYIFLAVLTFPHFSASIAVLLAYFVILDRWLDVPDRRRAFWLAALSLLLGILQPFDLLITAVVTLLAALTGLINRRLSVLQVLMLAPAAAVHALVVGYDWLAFNSHPVWQSFTTQNLTLSPPPIYYLFAYFWLLVPGVVGLVNAVRQRERRVLLPILWIGVVILLLYAPLPTQRRFLMGLQVPLALFAALGLDEIRRRWLRHGWQARHWRMLLTTGLLLSALTHVLFVASAAASANPEDRPLLYFSADERAAQDWLREQPEDAVIFSTFSSGGAIAGFTGRRVYIGHWIETMDFQNRLAEVEAFFAGDTLTEAEHRALLDDAGADLVWYDAAARELGSWPPDAADFLRLAFESETVAVYEVLP